MDIVDFENYCLSLPNAEESTPFDESTLVLKVGGKIFAAADMGQFDAFVVKCDPDEAVALRDAHAEITEAYHWNKRWWNAVSVTGDLPESFLRIYRRHHVRFVWVKGHAETVENNRCDMLAVAAAQGANLLEDTGYTPE